MAIPLRENKIKRIGRKWTDSAWNLVVKDSAKAGLFES